MSGVYIKKPNKKRRSLISAIILLIITTFSLVFFSDDIINTSLRVSRPFQAATWGVGDSVFGWALSITRAGNLKREVDSLLNDKERLTEEIVRLRIVREENEILRQALGLDMDRDFELVMANVSGKDILEEAIIIDRGFKDGISEGMPVVTEKRVVVGKIDKTFAHFSRVILATHQDSAVEAEVQDRNIIGLVEGLGDSGLRLTLIPKDSEIAEGDALITTPLSGTFPRGLFIGLIRSVERDDSQSFQSAEIAPFFNIRRLGKVFIITNQK